MRCLECLTGVPRAHREEEEEEEARHRRQALGKSTLAPTAAGGPHRARDPPRVMTVDRRWAPLTARGRTAGASARAWPPRHL